MEITEEQLNQLIDERALKIVKKFMQNDGFTIRKITDNPTDDLGIVNRKYVNMFGSIASRPQTSVIGQQYFSTTDGYPIFRNSNNAWVSATGSVIG